MFSPLVIPPKVPPELFVFCLIGALISRDLSNCLINRSLCSDPFILVPKKPILIIIIISS